jgi:hypothetical protein
VIYIAGPEPAARRRPLFGLRLEARQMVSLKMRLVFEDLFCLSQLARVVNRAPPGTHRSLFGYLVVRRGGRR